MTLNNLAGGVAGGAVGVDANTAFIMALLASFCMMKIGHSVGLYLNASVNEMKRIDTRLISGSIFACLAVTQLTQLLYPICDAIEGVSLVDSRGS